MPSHAATKDLLSACKSPVTKGDPGRMRRLIMEGEEASKWSWVLWKAHIELQKGKQRKIFTKATDKGGNTQSEERTTWNLRGVAYNGYEAVVGLEVV